MKTADSLSVHRTYDKAEDGKRSITLYVARDGSVERLSGKKLEQFITSTTPGTALRFTSVNAVDAMLLDLVNRGAVIQTAHWHETGIAKNLSPEEIVAAYAKLPDSLFRPFEPRKDIAELRNALSRRNLIDELYNNAKRQLRQVGRNMGIAERLEDNPDFEEDFEALKAFRTDIVTKNDKGRLVSFETRVAELAKKVPECVLFNQVSGISSSWIMAASVVAFSGGMDRFPNVASLWHYMGQHVIEGKMPRRKAGQPVTWSTNGRTVLYQLGESIIKNKNNPWRAYFDEAKAEELARHSEKHPGCKSPQGHCNAMARRKMAKEILKRFYLASQGIKYSSRSGRENHFALAAATGA
jgi:hypothetical protein